MSNRPNGVFKTENEYQKLLSQQLYDSTPKAVFAAIAVSFILNYIGEDETGVEKQILNEWRLLNLNKIVPQKPAKLK
jgi:hypothetical protein